MYCYIDKRFWSYHTALVVIPSLLLTSHRQQCKRCKCKVEMQLQKSETPELKNRCKKFSKSIKQTKHKLYSLLVLCHQTSLIKLCDETQDTLFANQWWQTDTKPEQLCEKCSFRSICCAHVNWEHVSCFLQIIWYCLTFWCLYWSLDDWKLCDFSQSELGTWCPCQRHWGSETMIETEKHCLDSETGEKSQTITHLKSTKVIRKKWNNRMYIQVKLDRFGEASCFIGNRPCAAYSSWQPACSVVMIKLTTSSYLNAARQKPVTHVSSIFMSLY